MNIAVSIYKAPHRNCALHTCRSLTLAALVRGTAPSPVLIPRGDKLLAQLLLASE